MIVLDVRGAKLPHGLYISVSLSEAGPFFRFVTRSVVFSSRADPELGFW